MSYQLPAGRARVPSWPAMIRRSSAARHRHVEQAAVLGLGLRAHAARAPLRRPAGRRPCRATRGRGASRLPPSRIVDEEELRVVTARRRAAGVGEDDDLRLEPLGAVHRHDADLAARHVHVALDFGSRGREPGEEAFEAGRLGALIVGAAPRNSSSASAASAPRRRRKARRPPSRASRSEKKAKGVLNAASSIQRCSRSVRRARSPARSRPPRAARARASPARCGGEADEVVVVEADQRRLEHGRQRQVVGRQQREAGRPRRGPSRRYGRSGRGGRRRRPARPRASGPGSPPRRTRCGCAPGP